MMTAVLRDALTFASTDPASLNRRKIDLAQLAQSVLASLGTDGKVRSSGDCVLEADEVAMKRALSNLAENAVKYGGAVRVALHRNAGALVIDIDDDGPGIPPADRERVFQPLVRLDRSRSRDS